MYMCDRSLKTQLMCAFSNVVIIDCRPRKCSASKKIIFI